MPRRKKLRRGGRPVVKIYEGATAPCPVVEIYDGATALCSVVKIYDGAAAPS